MPYSDAPISRDTTTRCSYNESLEARSTWSCYTGYTEVANGSGTSACTATPTITCPSCYTLNSSNQCVYETTNPSCYTCTGTEVSYNTSSYAVYSTPTLVGSTVKCSNLAPANLLTLTGYPSKWGLDGALDGQTSLCTAGGGNLLVCSLGAAIVAAIQASTDATLSSSLRDSSGFPLVLKERYTTPTTSYSCPAGFQCLTTGSSTTITSVIPCPRGFYCPFSVKIPSDPVQCPAGYYCIPSTQTTACSTSSGSTCAPGSMSPIECTTTGNYCEPGTTVAQGSVCPAGYYCPTRNEKFDCPMGTYSVNTGQTSKTSCITCDPGKYCPLHSSSQTSCTAGNYCPQGSGRQIPCPEGYYCADPAQPPVKCPESVYCPAGTATNYGLQCAQPTRPNAAYTACISCQVPRGAVYLNAAGCDTTLCGGHTMPDSTNSTCVPCTIASGSIWQGPSGCATTQCPVGAVSSASKASCAMASATPGSPTNTAQCIQGQEIDTVNGRSFVAIPRYSVTETPVYTMSMDIKVMNTHSSWRNIMSHGPDLTDEITGRMPAVFLAPTTNRIHIVHASRGYGNENIVTSFQAPLGTYFKLTWVVNASTLDTYIDKTKDASGSLSGKTFKWPKLSTQPWSWNSVGYPTNGSVYVKSVYFWNRALTSEEIQMLSF
jgi:hypothetical protein